MSKGKFIKGTIWLNGASGPVKYMAEFTPPPMRKEQIELSNLEGMAWMYDNTRFQDPSGSIKLSVFNAADLAVFMDSSKVHKLTAYAEYQVSDNGTEEPLKGNSLLMLVQFGGQEQSAMTPGDGGEFEIPYTPKSVAMKDQNGVETYFYDFFTHEFRINGVDQRALEKQLLGYS